MKSLPNLARDLVGRPLFEGTVVLVILTAALLIGLETSRSFMNRSLTGLRDWKCPAG